MKFFNYIFTGIIFISILFCGGIGAQNTVSPYSIFGPGEIQGGGFGTNKGMGGAGIALSSGNFLNNLNPASYVGMDSLRLIAEFGIEGKSYGMTTNQESLNGFTGNLSYLALGFKYTPWLAGSFGFVPFSSVGYSIDKTNYIEGTNEKYLSNFVGSGGITQAFFTNSVRFTPNLYFGVNSSLMFGTLTQEENIVASHLVPAMQITRRDVVANMYFDFGLQYHFATPKREYSFGVTYSFEQSLSSSHTVNAFDESNALVQSDSYKTDYLQIPEMLGVGIGVEGKRYTLALDYEYQAWSGLDYPTQDDEFDNSHRFTAGLELNPWEHRAINKKYKNWTYRFGFNYESTYLTFGNSNVTDRSITLGLGVPMYGALSKMDVSVTAGMNGTTENSLIEEKYLMFNIGFSLNEIAFLKRVID
jgi:hypothetical protein